MLCGSAQEAASAASRRNGGPGQELVALAPRLLKMAAIAVAHGLSSAAAEGNDANVSRRAEFTLERLATAGVGPLLTIWRRILAGAPVTREAPAHVSTFCSESLYLLLYFPDNIPCAARRLIGISGVGLLLAAAESLPLWMDDETKGTVVECVGIVLLVIGQGDEESSRSSAGEPAAARADAAII